MCTRILYEMSCALNAFRNALVDIRLLSYKQNWMIIIIILNNYIISQYNFDQLRKYYEENLKN